MPAPNLIIHGGAGNITRENLSPKAWAQYSASLLHIHRSTAALLAKGATALDAATHAVALFEDCPLFNCGKGAVFTKDGTIELESSIMVTNRYHKRYCAATLLTHLKNPIKFAREMLIRGGHDGSRNSNDDRPASAEPDAQGHNCLSGSGAAKLAEAWGLELVDPKYFWTRKRWEEHRRGLGKPTSDGDGFLDFHDAQGWNGVEYLPQGTVGCVALDSDGTLCVATSTGGFTNKVAGRIGDTPTSGAGFWAEQWSYQPPPPALPKGAYQSLDQVISAVRSSFADCLPSNRYHQIINEKPQLRAIAISGTGNGDSFLRLAACRTVGAIVRFSPPPPGIEPIRTLASALNQIAGPGGELQRSAGDAWGKTGEGQGGMIGIEFVENGKGGPQSEVVFDFNCGGMFRCWVDAQGKERVMVFREEY